MFNLEVKYQDLTIREYRLTNGDTRSIGRAPDNHIVLEDRGISREHACIYQLEDQLFIRDENSKHGTFVNGIQVTSSNLKPGDVVSIGLSHTLKVSVITENREATMTAIYNPEDLESTV